MLVHTSGEYFSDELDLPGEAKGKDGIMKFNAQTIGIAITYGRRYQISPFLGIASEEDTDGNGLDGDGGKKGKIPKYPPLPKKQKAKNKYTDEEIYRKCQDGVVALREADFIDKEAFDKDMEELKTIVDNYDMMETFHKSNVTQYHEGEKKTAIPKGKVKRGDKPQEEIF